MYYGRMSPHTFKLNDSNDKTAFLFMKRHQHHTTFCRTGKQQIYVSTLSVWFSQLFHWNCRKNVCFPCTNNFGRFHIFVTVIDRGVVFFVYVRCPLKMCVRRTFKRAKMNFRIPTLRNQLKAFKNERIRWKAIIEDDSNAIYGSSSVEFSSHF